jgi:hypothetical protein
MRSLKGSTIKKVEGERKRERENSNLGEREKGW